MDHNMIRLLPTGIIVHTTSECVIGGVPYPEIPTLIWPEGVDEAASDWFRYLIKTKALSATTVHQYAKNIRHFLFYCRRFKRKWDTVDDQFLIQWRTYLIRVREIDLNSVRYSLERIFEFYVWAEQSKRLRYHVGIYPQRELPSKRRFVTFPIDAHITRRSRKSGDVATGWRCTVLPKRGSRPARHTMTDEEMDRLHDVTMEGDMAIAERNSLLLSVPEETSTRRFETLQIKIDDVPEFDKILDMIEGDVPHHVVITRKRGMKQSILFNHDLLSRLRGWIDGERKKIIEKIKGRDQNFVDRGFVFISTTTGNVLNKDSVTSIFGNIFEKAGVEKASYHRVRAVYALRNVRYELDQIPAGVEVTADNEIGLNVLTSAANKMGVSPKSLKPYLTALTLNRTIQSPTKRMDQIEARARAAEHRFRMAQRRLQLVTGLEDVAKRSKENDDLDIPSLLRGLADEIEANPIKDADQE